MLYFFVFEMSYIKDMLNASSVNEYIKAKKKIKALKWLSIGSLALVFLPSTLYIIIDLNMDAFGRLMLYTRALAMFVPTILCFPICLYNLVFFAQQLSKDQGSLSFGLLLWAIFMWGRQTPACPGTDLQRTSN